MTVDIKTAAAMHTYRGTDYYFCNTGCAEAFDADPGRYVQTSTDSSA